MTTTTKILELNNREQALTATTRTIHALREITTNLRVGLNLAPASLPDGLDDIADDINSAVESLEQAEAVLFQVYDDLVKEFNKAGDDINKELFKAYQKPEGEPCH